MLFGKIVTCIFARMSHGLAVGIIVGVSWFCGRGYLAIG